MKKVFAILLTLVMAASLAACASTPTPAATEAPRRGGSRHCGNRRRDGSSRSGRPDLGHRGRIPRRRQRHARRVH